MSWLTILCGSFVFACGAIHGSGAFLPMMAVPEMKAHRIRQGASFCLMGISTVVSGLSPIGSFSLAASILSFVLLAATVLIVVADYLATSKRPNRAD